MLNRIWRKHPDFKRITSHGFRHTHCSLLFEAGATIKEVQERLGHENIQTTMDIYAHVTQKATDKVANKFASYIGFKIWVPAWVSQQKKRLSENSESLIHAISASFAFTFKGSG